MSTKFVFHQFILAASFATFALLAGCSGGGGGSDSGGSAPGGSDDGGDINDQASQASVISASLGQIRSADVRILDRDLVQIGEVMEIGGDGSVEVSISAERYPVVVEILGDADAEYFDEAAGSYLPFPSGSSLRAVIPSPQATIAVTVFTDMAAAYLEAGPGGIQMASSSEIRLANNAVRDLFLPGIDITRDVTIVGSSADRLSDTVEDIYAMVLAVFPTIAETKSRSTLEFLRQLARDWRDGVIDGQDNTTMIVDPVVADMDELDASIESELQGVIASYGNGSVDENDISALRVLISTPWQFFYSGFYSLLGEVVEIPETFIVGLPTYFVPTEQQLQEIRENFNESFVDPESGAVGTGEVYFSRDTNAEVVLTFSGSVTYQGITTEYELNYIYRRT